jgi:mRNA interferase MazF
MGNELKQGQIVLVQLDPIIGHEQAGTRPCVIVSCNGFNISGVVWVCPLTTKMKNFLGDVLVSPNAENNLDVPSEILVGQLRAIDKKRCMHIIGKITSQELQKIFMGIDILLGR